MRYNSINPLVVGYHFITFSHSHYSFNHRGAGPPNKIIKVGTVIRFGLLFFATNISPFISENQRFTSLNYSMICLSNNKGRFRFEECLDALYTSETVLVLSAILSRKKFLYNTKYIFEKIAA